MKKLLLVFLILMAANIASAHALAPALLQLTESATGDVAVLWKTPLVMPSGTWTHPILPGHCSSLGTPQSRVEKTGLVRTWDVTCGAEGLVGETIQIRGLAESKTNALVRIELSDGRVVQELLGGAEASLRVPEAGTELGVARDYLALGIEHLLSGLDHVLFVLGLMLLIQNRRRLLITITAFTVGHSVTLSLAVLGFVTVPQRVVEVAIAASIVFLAAAICEKRSSQESTFSAYPWTMALFFGLLHGLGFAGALAELGLPQQEIPLALFAFNCGIEIGQLFLIFVALIGWHFLLKLRFLHRPWLEPAVAYGIGSIAAYWCFERIAFFFVGFGS